MQRLMLASRECNRRGLRVLIHTLFAVLMLFGPIGPAHGAITQPFSRIDTVVQNVEIQMTRNPIFKELAKLAARHGFEIYLEKQTADSMLRVIGTGALPTKHRMPALDFLGANEKISIVVVGSDFHLELLNSLISRFLERTSLLTGKSRWQTRLETPLERELPPRLAKLVPKVYIHCRTCTERVDRSSIEFFLDNEIDERSTLSTDELYLSLLELKRVVEVRPVRIKPELFQSILVLLSRLNVYRIRDNQLPAIYEVMTSIDSSLQTPGVLNGTLRRELTTLGFEKAYREVSDRILERPEYGYDIDLSKVPDSVVQRARAVMTYAKWTAKLSCQSIFESTAQ